MVEVRPEWILITGAGVLIFSLFEAWLATLIIYGKVQTLKRIFPATRNLILSHVDYTIMTGLAGFSYFSVTLLNIELPAWVIVTLCVGIIYNPLGFFFKAMKPDIANFESFIGKTTLMLGFVPATVGFVYVMVEIIRALT